MLKPLLAAFLALAFAALATPAAAQRGCEVWGTPTKPGQYGPTLKVPGPNPVSVRKATSQVRCSNNIGPVLVGWVSMPDERVLVPAAYQTAIMINSTRAIVSKVPAAGQPKRWMIYEVGKGEVAPAPAFSLVTMISSGIALYVKDDETYTPVGFLDRPDGRKDAYIYSPGAAEPKIIPGVGGPGVDPLVGRQNGILFANFSDDKGGVVSRLLDLNGDPISPIVGRIEAWSTLSVLNTSGTGDEKNILSKELLTLISSGANPELPSPGLFLPLAYDGMPKAVPAGVVGVFPLIAQVDFRDWTKASYTSANRTLGWGVVRATPKGMAIAYGLGPLDGVLAGLDRLPAATAMKRQLVGDFTYNKDFLLVRDAADGRWRTHWGHSLNLVDLPGLRAGFATPDDAVKGWQAAEVVRVANDEKIAAENKARWAAQDEAAFQAILASGKLCERWHDIIQLNKAAITRLIQDCVVYDSRIMDMAKARGVDPGLIAKVASTQQGMAQAAQAKRDQESRDGWAWANAHPKPNWNAWGDAAMKSMQSSNDAFMAQSRQTYTRNLEAWTSGAQNWGGPK